MVSTIKKDELIVLASAFITTEGEGETGGEGGGGEEGAAADDLATLFSPEEVEAKRTSVTEAKAEEDRRAALTDEERTTEDAAAAEAAKAGEVPEKYEFSLPEGTTVDEELMAEVSKFATDNKLTQAEAQRIADLGATMMAKQTDLKAAEYENIKTEWLTTAKADKEIGADISKGKDSVAARAFNTIATPEMKEMVDQYGIGNHPEMLRMFYRLSSLMAEDGMQMPGTGAGSATPTGAEGTVGSIFNHPDRQK